MPPSSRIVLSEKCVICGMEPRPHSYYCARCFRLIARRYNTRVPQIEALKRAWNPEQQAFLCHYTGVKLDVENINNPWYLVFDHKIPGKKKTLFATSFLINCMKSSLSDEEFKAFIKELARFWKEGGTFNKAVIQFRYRRKKVKPAENDAVPSQSPANTSLYYAKKHSKCIVCEKRALLFSLYCQRCRKFIMKLGGYKPRRIALQRAWSKERNGFLCRYSGVKLEEYNWKSPWYLSFDHRIPRKKDDLQVVAFIFNEIKMDLSDEEFVAFVNELARHWNEGTPFNKDIIKYEYWHRRKNPQNEKA